MSKKLAILLVITSFSLLPINAFARNYNYIDVYLTVPNNSILFESGIVNERFGTSTYAPNSDYWFVDGTDLIIPLQRDVISGYMFKIALDNAEWMFQSDIQVNLSTFNKVRGSLNDGIYTRNTSDLGTLAGKDIDQPKTIINGTTYSEGQYSLEFSSIDSRVAVVTVLQNYTFYRNIIFRIPLVAFIKDASKAAFVIVDAGGSAGVASNIHAFMIPPGISSAEQIDFDRWWAEEDIWVPRRINIPSPTISSTVKEPLTTAGITDETLTSNLKVSVTDALYKLGLFAGTGTDTYELDKKLTRLEALALVIRLMGQEKEAMSSTEANPFTDVPVWGERYAAYGYLNGIITGINRERTLFEPDRQVTFQEFTALLLRVLDYYEANGDFKYEDTIQKASDIGMFSPYNLSEISTANFLRSNAVMQMADALLTYPKDSDEFLIYGLADKGVFSKTDAYWFASLSAGN